MMIAQSGRFDYEVVQSGHKISVLRGSMNDSMTWRARRGLRIRPKKLERFRRDFWQEREDCGKDRRVMIADEGENKRLGVVFMYTMRVRANVLDSVKRSLQPD